MWVALIFAAMTGYNRASWWWPALIAVIFTISIVAINYSWWQDTGLIRHWPRFVFLGGFATFIMTYAAYGFGRGARRVFTGPERVYVQHRPQPPADDWSAEDMERAGQQLEQLAAGMKPRRSALSDDVLKDRQ